VYRRWLVHMAATGLERGGLEPAALLDRPSSPEECAKVPDGNRESVMCSRSRASPSRMVV